jgi:MarR family transcriptional regulator, 2-MHQ and catechol-resistance regulon repressor
VKLQSTKTYGKFADKAMRTWIQVSRTFNKIRAKEATYIKSFGLTMHQFQVLEVLYHRGDLTVGSITKLTMSTPGNITVVIRNLKRDGYIKSVHDPKDKRVSLISITQKGKEIMAKFFPGHAKNFEKYFQNLSEDEIETLFTILRKLHKAQ